MRTSALVLFSTLAILSGCATAPTPTSSTPAALAAVPSYITAERGCAVLVGGSVGSAFADQKITAFWTELNKQIADLLYESLVNDKYKAVKLTVSVAENGSTDRLVMQALARNRCNRIIQLSHDVNEDSNGRYFRFDVMVMRIVPKGERAPGTSGTSVVTVGDYKREYRYPRTAAAFDSFHTGTFATAAYSDLKASGSLESLR